MTTGRSSALSTVTPSTFTATTSVTVESVVAGLGSSEPTISSAKSDAVTELAGTVVTVLPRRMTVMVSEISSTSWSLWSMKMIVDPASFSCGGCGTLFDLLGDEHGRRLVENEDLGAR
ncbi:MAG: hypothetical protein R2706_20880 [Acidimicrobiales bacterium]